MSLNSSNSSARALEQFSANVPDSVSGGQKAIFEKWPNNKLSRMALVVGTGFGAYVGYELAANHGNGSLGHQIAFVAGGAVAGNLAAQILVMLSDGAWGILGPSGSRSRGIPEGAPDPENVDENGRYLGDFVPENKVSNTFIALATALGAYLGYYQTTLSGGMDLARTILMIAVWAIGANIAAQIVATLTSGAWSILGPE